MELNDVLTISISLVATTVSVFSYFRAAAIAKANNENNIQNSIRSSRVSLYDISKQLMLLERDENEKLVRAKYIYSSLVEDYINVYKEACAKYLDNKIDRKRFKKNYMGEIRQLVEGEEINSIINFKEYKNQIEYEAILKVYFEWYKNE